MICFGHFPHRSCRALSIPEARWVHDAGGLTAGTVSLETVRTYFLGEILGKNAPSRITGAEKQYLLLLVGHRGVL